MLSDQVVHMSDDAWRERYLHIRRICQETGEVKVDSLAHSIALHDWLEHQKALAALGASAEQATYAVYLSRAASLHIADQPTWYRPALQAIAAPFPRA